ncbi:glycogen synthase [Bradyrhizobium diazoefficiens]
MTPARVLAVASEVYPIVKTGGLADVAGALPIALKAHGVEMRTLMPGYPDVMRLLSGAEEIRRWPDYFGGPGRLLAGAHDGLDLFVLDVPHLYARPGKPIRHGRGGRLAGQRRALCGAVARGGRHRPRPRSGLRARHRARP